MDKQELWDYLEENEIATLEEIRLVCGINGYNEQSLLDILYYKTGYNSVEQMEDED